MVVHRDAQEVRSTCVEDTIDGFAICQKQSCESYQPFIMHYRGKMLSSNCARGHSSTTSSICGLRRGWLKSHGRCVAAKHWGRRLSQIRITHSLGQWCFPRWWTFNSTRLWFKRSWHPSRQLYWKSFKLRSKNTQRPLGLRHTWSSSRCWTILHGQRNMARALPLILVSR